MDTVLPQSAAAGFAWKIDPKRTLSGQMDWTQWSVFNSLPVTLTNGSNSDINGVAGSTSLGDNIPLKWSDRISFRTGIEYAINGNFALRAGYIYAQSPVPDSTLTPLTTAISEHTLTVGIGYYSIDLAYQYSLPKTRAVGTSELLSGEANGSSVKVSIHTFTATASIKF